MRSNKLVLPPIRLVASATAINSAGKNARKRLKAIACEITLPPWKYAGKHPVHPPKEPRR